MLQMFAKINKLICDGAAASCSTYRNLPSWCPDSSMTMSAVSRSIEPWNHGWSLWSSRAIICTNFCRCALSTFSNWEPCNRCMFTGYTYDTKQFWFYWLQKWFMAELHNECHSVLLTMWTMCGTDGQPNMWPSMLFQDYIHLLGITDYNCLTYIKFITLFFMWTYIRFHPPRQAIVIS